MRLGVSLEPLGPDADRDLLLGTAVHAERAGFDSVVMSSHVLRNAPGSAVDPLVVLAAAAGATTTLRLATSVLVLPYYQPVVLANQAASLDVLSGGRFTLAVGAGWNPDEFAAVGVPVAERGARTDEGIAVLRALWSGEPADFAGRFVTLRGATVGIPPVTAGGPPVRVGGHSDAALRRALRLGDGWHGAAVDPEGMADVRTRLDALGGQVGRDPAELELSTLAFLVPPGVGAGPAPGHALGGEAPSRESVLDELGRLAEAGISFVALWMPVPPERMGAALDWVAAEILPAA